MSYMLLPAFAGSTLLSSLGRNIIAPTAVSSTLTLGSAPTQVKGNTGLEHEFGLRLIK